MQDNNKMDTLTERIEDLKNRGFKEEFEVVNSKLACQKGEGKYTPEQVKIVEHYRFEGQSDPGDMTVLYGLIADDGTKGVLTDGFGTYSNQEVSTFLQKLTEIHKGSIY
ncbi:MAG: phosphoribosylpyrophosphate synthetase [Chitinophagaceae bacterium]|nr:MAG: phosphoribosylpyrophosphate synthetase [Chitinophagaceae bacterium]